MNNKIIFFFVVLIVAVVVPVVAYQSVWRDSSDDRMTGPSISEHAPIRGNSVKTTDPVLPTGKVWYPIPELGIRFQVDEALASELIYTPVNALKDRAFFFTGTNMTGDTIFFVAFDTRTGKIAENEDLKRMISYDPQTNKGVLFSTRQLAEASPHCGASSGELGMLFAGSAADAYSDEAAQTQHAKSSVSYGKYKLAFLMQHCWSSGMPKNMTESANARKAYALKMEGGDIEKFWEGMLSTMTSL